MPAKCSSCPSGKKNAYTVDGFSNVYDSPMPNMEYKPLWSSQKPSKPNEEFYEFEGVDLYGDSTNQPSGNEETLNERNKLV